MPVFDEAERHDQEAGGDEGESDLPRVETLLDLARSPNGRNTPRTEKPSSVK